MSKPPPKSKRKRIWVNRKRHDKIVEYAEKTEQFLGAIHDEMIQDYIDKHDL